MLNLSLNGNGTNRGKIQGREIIVVMSFLYFAFFFNKQIFLRRKTYYENIGICKEQMFIGYMNRVQCGTMRNL